VTESEGIRDKVPIPRIRIEDVSDDRQVPRTSKYDMASSRSFKNMSLNPNEDDEMEFKSCKSVDEESNYINTSRSIPTMLPFQ
jgi:hypothetical protein